MIEIVENLIQLAMTGTCAGVALYRALRSRERAWAMLGLFSGIFFLGDLYWLLFLIFYENTPRYYSVSDLSWYTSFLFLLLLLIYVRVEICGHRMPAVETEGGLRQRLNLFPAVLWCVPAFTALMCAFYMRWGDYLSNVLAAILMTGIIWHALSALLASRSQPGQAGLRMFCLVTLLFCAAEYALWTASCFWGNEDTLTNIYYWFDLLLSITFVMFLPALGRVVAR